MYVDTTTSRRGNKTYVRHLLRTSFRENGKVRHKTLANLSICSNEEITAIKLALKHKGNLASIASLSDIETTPELLTCPECELSGSTCPELN